MDMEKQAVRFKRVYGEMFTTTEETNKALQDIKNLANEFTKYGVAVSKTMELAADVAATGKMGAELTAQVAETTRLAVLGGVEQAEALEATISLTDAFGVSAEDLAGKIDFLNAVENQTITSIEDLTIAIPKAGPVVQQLGGDVEDLTFFLTAMREGGINASEGANALKSGLAALINPTGKASEMLAEFGINIKGIVEANQGDVRGLVVDFASALDTLDPLNRARAIEQLFGKFQFSRLSTLFQNVIKDGNQASRVLKLSNATAAELAVLSERELKKVEDSPMFKFQKALEDIKVTLVPLGEAFLKAVTPLLEFGTSILKKFNELDEGAKGFVVGLTAIAGVIGPVFLMGFGLIANGVANVIKGFVFFKTALNKAGSASTQLGMQTEYMTQQQLEAAAVAASLDQVHSKLKQTFTSEAAAINALTAAYERAILKQAAFAGTPMAVGRGAKSPKKLASGIVSVPGPKGAGDIVPAMLSPGEAIIPADKAEKYRGFIQALISGNIPGFENGTGKVVGYTSATTFLPDDKKINNRLANPGQNPVTGKELSQAYKSGGKGLMTPLISEIAKQMGHDTPQKLEQAMAKNPALKKNFDRFAGAVSTRFTTEFGKMQFVDDAKFTDKAKTIISEESKKVNKSFGRATDKVFSNYNAFRDNTVQSLRQRSSGKLQLTDQGRASLFKDEASYKDKRSTYLKTAALFGYDVPAKSVMAHVAKPNSINLEEAAKGRTLSKTAEAARARLARGEKTIYKSGKPEKKISVPAGTTPAQAKKLIDSENKAKKASVAATEKETKSRKASAATIKQESETRSKAAATATKPGQSQRVVARETKQGTRYYVGNKLVPDQKAGQTTYNRQQGAAKGVETRRANAAMRANQVAQAPQDQRGASGGRGGMGMAGMVASGAVMAGSMLPGSAGKVAQDLMMPVMALSMILPMLPAGIGIAVAAIAALAMGAFALKGAFDKAQKEAMEMTETLGSGKKAILAYAEFAGAASAGEIMDKQRADAASPFSVQQGKTTFGESFVAGEQGKAMLDSLRKSVAEKGSSATQAQLVNQLGTAVASGALNEAQARSIAASIGKELGNQTFGINVNAKLIEIFGPNGENLVNEPLEVRVKMIQETQDRLGAVAQASQPKMTEGGFQAGGGAALAAGGVAATALGVAGALAAAGVIAQAVPVVGTVAGGIALAVAGATALGVGIWQGVEGMTKMGEASATNVAMGMVAMQQQKEMLDSLDLEYQRRIANAIAAGDVAKAEELTTQHILDREALLAKNAETTKMVLDNFTNQGSFLGMNFNQGAYKEAASKALTTAYADDPVMGQIAKGAYDKTIAAGGLNDTQEYQMTLLLANKELDPGMVMQLLDSFGNDKEQMTKILNIMTNIGSADGNRAIALMNAFVDENGDPLPEQQKTFIANIESKTPAQAQKSLAMFEEVAKLGGANVVETSVIMQFYNKNPQAQAKMENMIEQINSYGGELTMDFVQNLVGEGQFEAFKQNQAYFESLDNEQRKDYVSAFVNTMELQGDKDMQDAWRAWQKTLPADQKARAFEDFATVTAVRVTEAGIDRTAKPVEEEDTGGGGGGPSASPLDDLLKKLRDVRKNQIGVAKGFEASANAINKLFGDGKGINLFSGLENDMRRLGAGEDLITLIAGMDPEEFAKKKNSLFNFNRQTGEIIGFKNQLVNIGKALSSIAVGQYVNDQQRAAQEAKNQVGAFNELRAAGYSVAEAYEAVQDASLAAALVSGNITAGEVKDMLESRKRVLEEQKKLARLTPEGLQEVFTDGFNKAMEAFDAQEKKLTIEYELKIADDQKLIDDAQSQIAGLQYKIDDYEADLRGIEDQENAINKTYDEKLAALEKVRKANQKVLDQEKGRLSVAEAITRGDLAAAARAAQDVRAASASGYFSDQTDALNAGRQSALNAVRSKNGLSRIEIEEQIKTLADQIFEIEENTLEPATERVRLAGEELAKRIKELEVLGNTKAEWEAIKNKIDVARTNSAGYKAAMTEAAKEVQNILDKWNEIEKPKETVHTITTIRKEGDASDDSFSGDGDGSDNNYDPLDPKLDTPEAQAHRIRQALNDPSTAPKVSKALRDAAGVTLSASADKATELINRYLAKITKAQADAILATAGVTGRGSGGGGGGAVVTRKADGGPVSGPGTGRSDSIPALLSNGEYVIKASSVDKFGNGFLDSINAGVLPAFRDGGLVKRLGARLPNLFNSGKPSPMGPASRIPPAGSITPPFMKPSFASKIPSTGPMTPSFIKPSFTKDFAQQSYKSPSGPRMNAVATLRPAIKPEANAATNNQSSVYNYNLSVNVASQSDPNVIAQTVMGQIRNVDSQRIRGNRFYGN
jgi:TP901 family phage tail tape measure protein